MKKRIFSSIFFVALAVIILITSIVTFSFYQLYSSSQINTLKNESQLVIHGVENEGLDYFDGMKFDNYRITWIENNGTVKYDSSVDVTEMENHLEREEVQEALNTGYGESVRYSDSILKESYYVAYKLDDGTIMRLSITQDSIFYMILTTLYPLYIVAFSVFIIALVLAFYISKKIVDPLNHLDLEHPLENNKYPEIEPLLNQIDVQHTQLKKDKEEVEKASLIRQEFTANVSHEMKTPLHIISGYAELIKEGIAKPEDIKNFSVKIYDESHRLSRLVEDIMQLSKLDNNEADEEKTQIQLDVVCQNVIDSLALVAQEKKVEIHSKLSSCEIYGMPNVIHSMVYNLIDNAIKYNKENGQIWVKLTFDGFNHTILSVSDTGIGIPEKDVDRIFERFYRVDKSHSREIGGTGLGLSIVKHGAMVHHAKVEVESTLNEGSTFRIIF